MICPKCGAKLEEGTRVCPICGKSLVATSVGTVFKRRDLQEYDELSSDEYDDSDYQDDGSYEEEQYDDTYQDDEYDDGSYEEEQYDDGYEAESGPYDNENNEVMYSLLETNDQDEVDVEIKRKIRDAANNLHAANLNNIVIFSNFLQGYDFYNDVNFTYQQVDSNQVLFSSRRL